MLNNIFLEPIKGVNAELTNSIDDIKIYSYFEHYKTPDDWILIKDEIIVATNDNSEVLWADYNYAILVEALFENEIINKKQYDFLTED